MIESFVLRGVFSLLFACLPVVIPSEPSQDKFSFAPYLDLARPSPTLFVKARVAEGRTVRVEGADAAKPDRPFVFDWGDGSTSEGWFPAVHAYDGADRDYVIKVTARYPGETHTVQTVVRFLPGRYDYRRVKSVPRRMTIPRKKVKLTPTMPGWDPPSDAMCFEDADITTVPRDAIEYVLDVGHALQMDYCNGDVTRWAARRQVVLKQTSFAGCGSIWFTDPAAQVCHPDYLAGDVGFSSLLHEMAHNLTLNSPARYRFGGKTDGPMNAIVSETLAVIFQHATIHEILNAPGRFGLSEDLQRGLRTSGIRSLGTVREGHRNYLADPEQYTTYNDPSTEEDDTFNTFMTVAYVFLDLAEKHGNYREALKRMMRLLQTFSESDRMQFQQPANESFRATFLVAAMSHGFKRDLRDRFRKLHFPVSSTWYATFLERMK